MPIQISKQDRQLARNLKVAVKYYLYDELCAMKPSWLISFHYRDNHCDEDALVRDVAQLKRKFHRIIYKSRDKSVKGAGKYLYPRMLFVHEVSHQGTGQYHTHLILEGLPRLLNTKGEMQALFQQRLPNEVVAMSKWKSVDIQPITPRDDDFRRISGYLGKQASLGRIPLDPFNSDLSPNSK